MKTSLIIAVIIVLHKIPKAKGKEKFACPEECPPNVYRPVCSRGKSYVNLCILKQQICKGKIAREIYDDVEKCPGYEKDEDASGKSIEAIDKNGVLFRHLIEDSNVKSSSRTEVPRQSVSNVQMSKKSHRKSKMQKDHKGERSKTTCPRSCSVLVKSLSPFFNLGIDFARRCPLQFLFCRPFIQSVSVNFIKNCQKSGEDMNLSASEDESPFGSGTELFDVPLIENILKSSTIPRGRESDEARVETTGVRKVCQIKCDVNDDRPVCSKNTYFRNECYLKEAFCNGWIDKDVFMSAKECHSKQRGTNQN